MQSSTNYNHDRASKFLAQLEQCALFADALILCLHGAKLRQIELAQRLFVEAATVHNWRTNKRLPDAAMVLRIAAALGLESKQQQMLVDTWRVTRRARELIHCVEETKRSSDMVTLLTLEAEYTNQLAQAKRQLQAAKWRGVQAEAGSAERMHDLDPEIWLYSGY